MLHIFSAHFCHKTSAQDAEDEGNEFVCACDK
jgi:hypothetical protein